MRGGGVSGGGRLAARGGLYLPVGLFGASMSSRVLVIISPDKPRGPKRHLTNTGMNIRSILPI